MPEAGPAPPGSSMRTFLIIWLGQAVSAIGTALSAFALGIWVFTSTRSATSFTMVAFFASTPLLVLAPLAGVVADRRDRRRLLLATDLLSAAMTAAMALAFASGRVRVWYVYPYVAAVMSLGVFRSPALLASVSLLVPRRHLARASGMSAASAAAAAILGPLLAGAMIAPVGYRGLLLIDAATFLVGALALALVRIPRLAAGAPGAAEDGRGRRRSPFASQAAYGWHYIWARPGLLMLMLLFLTVNFSLTFVQALLGPLILSFASPAALGAVNAVLAGATLAGAVALSAWGGPRQRVPAILCCLAVDGALLIAGGSRPSLPLIGAAGALFMFTIPIVNGCSEAIWQSKVPNEVQGRVFGARRTVALAVVPLAYLLSGPLADRVCNPLLMSGGALAGSLGRWIGVGPGRGIGLLFLVMGVAVLATVAGFSRQPRLRCLEQELPDAAATAPPTAAAPGFVPMQAPGTP